MSEILCQICELTAHGNHFGAITCRACSAFFRRSLIDKSGENFKCLRGNDSCQLKYSGKFYCKKCRLKRCYEVGMNPKYIQHNRDKIKSSPSPPQSISTLVGRPSYIIHCSPVANASKITIVDVTYLIDKANDCLDYGPALLNKKLKILDKMNIANEFLDSFEASEYSKMDQMTQIPVLDKNFFMHFWEVDFLKTAKWLSFLDGFEKIPRATQIQILMATWHLRARIDRLSKTAKLRKQMKIGEADFMMSSNACLDLKTCKLDISWCSDYPNEQIQFFLEGSDDWVHNQVVDQMEELDPSEIEIAFMTCQFCFHYAGKRLQGYILTEMEKYLDLISNDLHRYYQENGIKNYSERITRMMKINNWIQMPTYKLTYFNARGYAEPARLLFHLAGVPFEDFRMTHGDGTWEKIKDSTPFGQVPVLSVDGTEIPQSMAIIRYLANKFGYAGKTPEEKAWVDAIVDQYKDFMSAFMQFVLAQHNGKPTEEVERLKTEVYAPAKETYIKILNGLLEKSKSGFLVGDGLTFADLVVVENLFSLEKNQHFVAAEHSKLLALKEKVYGIPAIKEYVESRPDTQF